jgi:hypothetical protein
MGLTGQQGQFPRKFPPELFRKFEVARNTQQDCCGSQNSGNIISGISCLLAISFRAVDS